MIQIRFDSCAYQAHAERLASIAVALKIPVQLIQESPRAFKQSSGNLEAAAALIAQEIKRQQARQP